MHKKYFLVLFILLFFSLSSFAAARNILKIWNDGTAYVQGVVVGNTIDCATDGYCSLIVNVKGQQVTLIYNDPLPESFIKNPARKEVL